MKEWERAIIDWFRTMDNLVKDIASSDTMARLAALEKTASKLPNKNWLRDVSSDTKMKLMSGSTGAIKDANPKVVAAALNCLDLLIRVHKDDFSPLVNMSFELLIGKLGDNKTAIREQALQVLLELVSNMSINATFERITANITHKNQRVKESLLAVIARLQEVYGTELRPVITANSMCTTLAVLVNDAQASTRSLAVTTLANLYQVYGEDLVNALGRCEFRPAQQKLLLEAVLEQKQRPPSQPSSRAAPASAVQNEVDPWSLLDDEDSHAAPNGKNGSQSPNATHLKTGGVDFSQTSRPAAARRSISATQRRPSGTTTANNFGSTMGTSSLASSVSSFAPGDSLGSNGTSGTHGPRAPSSAYDPEGFMHFIQLKSGLRATEIVDERDLAKLTAKIATDLAKKSDWEARTNALVALQKLAWGNLTDFKQSVELIRAMHDLVSSQIIDLRSTVSKEACKAVAALAYALRQQFSPLAETWWLHLVRVVVVKIQVISSSADKCIRVIVASCPDQRLLMQIIESCTAKAPPLRKLGLEYLSLACAAWKPEIIERNVSALKQVVRVAVADSDPAARKTARQLYWVLHNSSSMQPAMKAMFNDLDAATQRHIQNEATTDSAEMTDLFHIVQNPSCLLECARRADFSSSSKSDQADSAPEAPVSVKGRPPSAGLKPPTKTTTRSAAAPSPAPVQAKEEVISEFDILTQDEMSVGSHRSGTTGIASHSASSSGPSTAARSTRRMSLTGPVRLTQPLPEDEDSFALATAAKPSSVVGSRRLSLAANGSNNLPTGRTLTRSTDFGASMTVDHGYAEQHREESVGNVISVNSLLQTLGAPLSGSSLLGQGAVRSFDAKTPAVKSSYASSTRPSFITRQEQAAIEEEMPSHSQKVFTSAPTADEPDMFASDHFSDAPAPVVTSSLVSRRGSLGSTLGGSALGNGPKRIVRAAPAMPVAPVVEEKAPARHVPPQTPATPATVQKTSSFLSDQVNTHVVNAETIVNSPVPSSASNAENVFVFSGETLRAMVADEHWEQRVKAFESINSRLQRAASTQETLNEGIVETFLDLCLPCLADPHHKVATESLEVLQSCITSYPQHLKSRLGAVLLALFHRLADRRPALRDQSNSVLNLVRTTLDPVQVMAALSPRMGEVPDRMKTALMQFMGAIAPHCDVFFQVGANTWAFLSRMAHIIGTTGAKPSLTLTVAARRLLELVYKTSPQMICTQIAALPLQQQISLKKYLEASVPDIDHQVTLASKAEWSSKVSSNSGSSHDLLNSPVKLSTQHDALDVSTASSVFEVRTTLASAESAASAQLSQLDAYLSEHEATTTVTRPTSAFKSGATTPPTPLPVPSAVPSSVSAQSPAPPVPPAMEFSSRNLSAAAVEVEVRVLEYLDSCRHSQSPSENVSPNSPGFSRGSAVKHLSGSDSKPSTPSYMEDPLMAAVLADKLALDAATEEIIQRYSPKSSPAGAYASSSAPVDPLAASLYGVLSPGYSEYAQATATSRTSLTPQRPTQLPQRRSMGNSPSQTSSPESVEPAVDATSSVAGQSSSTPNRSTPQKNSTPGSKRAPPLSATAQFADHNDVTRPASAQKTASASKAQLFASPAAARHPSSSAGHAGSANGKCDARGSAKDTLWLLEHLKPSASLRDREEASKELKQRIKAADDTFWLQNYAQVVTVLLDSFRAEVCNPSVTNTASSTSSSSSSAGAKAALAGYEHVEFSTKSLILLMRYRAPHMKNLIEVLADKLSRAGEFVPGPIAQSLEAILSELAKQDALRLVTALLPYATLPLESSGADESGVSAAGENPQVRILALHALCNSVKHLSSAQLLALLPALVPSVLSSVNSSLADLRKAVIFILVEVYLCVGDSLFPYVATLTPPQRKLLTIYIEKRLTERKQSVDAAMCGRS